MIQGKDEHLTFLINLVQEQPEHELVQAMLKAADKKLLMPVIAGYLERMAIYEDHIKRFGIDHDCVASQCFSDAGVISLLFAQMQVKKNG